MTESLKRRWTNTERALWTRLQAHSFEDASLGLDFCRRLAREQGWTQQASRHAIEEYRRFCFLACVSAGDVTPSKEIDEVWHLHLCYTRDYWQQFCPLVLEQSLHHGPTAGGKAEAQRYREQYARTLALYERYFGPPPARWWPGTRERFAREVAPARVDRRRFWVIPKPRWPGAAAAVSAVLALATLFQTTQAEALPSNPLDWTAGPFLQLFFALAITALIGSILLRRLLRETGAAGGVRPDTFELAYLAGGPERCTDAAVAHLLASEQAVWDESGRKLALTEPAPEGADAPASVARCIAADGNTAKVLKRSAVALAPLRNSLERKRLWLGDAEAWRVRLFSAMPMLLIAGFGGAKIAVGMSRDKPVGFLVMLTLIVGMIGLGFLLSRPKRTRAGDLALTEAKQRHARAIRAPQQKELGLAVALLGTAALSGTAYAQYHQLRAPPSSSGDSSGDDSSEDSGDSGGDSDSGRDSGCGGGGCGGCGGD